MKDVAAGGVGARLKDGPDFLPVEFYTERAEGFTDGGGMMGEIIHHGDTPANAADFHAALDAFKGIESRLDLVVFQAAMAGGGGCAKRVADIEFAEKIQPKFETRHFKFSNGRREHKVGGAPGVVLAETETLNGTMRDVEQRREARVVAIGEKLAVARDQIDKTFEGSLDDAEILEDVGVVGTRDC